LLTAKRAPKPKEMKPAMADLSGRWDVNVKFYNSEDQHKFFLQQEGNWIKGTHQGGFAVNDMIGSIEGDQVKLRSSVRIVGDSITYTFTGTVKGDQLSGDLFMGEYRSAKFSALRDTKPMPKEPIFVPSGAPLAS
jgi:D-glucosaminate-6-phosphate ammonia-lyase